MVELTSYRHLPVFSLDPKARPAAPQSEQPWKMDPPCKAYTKPYQVPQQDHIFARIDFVRAFAILALVVRLISQFQADGTLQYEPRNPLDIAIRAFFYCLACIPLVILISYHEFWQKSLSKSKFMTVSMVYIAVSYFAIHGCCRCFNSTVFATKHPEAATQIIISKLANYIHVLLTGPALWATGLPLEHFPFPAKYQAHYWMLCMLPSIVLVSITAIVTFSTKSVRPFPTTTFAFIFACMVSALWILAAIAASAL